ncbi:uncharacterized protein LOC124441291 [Xenia sp. Carnegie-2017]|uniref:uncharacterized protein LOC124441291 n=1 Tax=Xenia sp. Carnegie-2017 TaxID=2897299 RepID=UPI001F047BED|nr:uncharacterized protein LOC124441291 [Xenia sp. Carnegie-2017]
MMMIIVMTVVLNVVPICGCPLWCQIHSSNCKMDANASNGSPRAGQLINNILARVEELSEVISPCRENSELSSINEEVARSFNRGGRGYDINLQQSTATSSTGFQLMKEWKGYEVEMHVRNAFGDKLKDHNIDIEIVMSVHNTLHPPCLAPNQTLNGFMVHKVFKDKPIYVRPSVQILEPLSNRINKPEHLNDREDLCIVQDDSSDMSF